jgi:RimJ/RimL family protein N-acetyltransferase
MVKTLIKSFVRTLVGEYEFYAIYAWQDDGAAGAGRDPSILGEERLHAASAPEIRSLAHYTGADSRCFVLEESGTALSACCYWFGERYRTERGFWKLEDREAKLVQITTVPGARGRGLARRLIAASSRAMADEGFRRLYARVWRGHRASQRAFEAAGWRRIAHVVGVETFGRRIRLKLPW